MLTKEPGKGKLNCTASSQDWYIIWNSQLTKEVLQLNSYSKTILKGQQQDYLTSYKFDSSRK